MTTQFIYQCSELREMMKAPVIQKNAKAKIFKLSTGETLKLTSRERKIAASWFWVMRSYKNWRVKWENKLAYSFL